MTANGNTFNLLLKYNLLNYTSKISQPKYHCPHNDVKILRWKPSKYESPPT